jgi:hypothetical protein
VPLNAFSPILVTELGIIIDCNAGQLKNIPLPILRSFEVGVNVTLDNKVQFENTLPPILVTELPITIDCNFAPLNTLSPILVTELPIVTSVN